MNKKLYLLLLTVFIGACSSNVAPNTLDNVGLTEITPAGWLNTMLENEKTNFIDRLDSLIYPFNEGGWGREPYLKKDRTGYVGSWVPYEQSAYYCDGVLRNALLRNDDELIHLMADRIHNVIANASPEGIIEPVLSKGDRRRWPHAVFFRSMMAYYEATGEEDVINAMTRHYLNDTVALAGRDLVNVEAMTWLYQKTGNEKIYKKVEEIFESGAVSSFQEDEIGDYEAEERQEIHGVTYNEMLKLPIMRYMLTGDKNELEKARNGFRKLDRYHMLPDGVNSSEEGVSGKGSRNTHETCDIVDYMWTCSYMQKVTREVEWGDRMERALFNAGMGCITKDFDAHQYYSCPNQVYCDDYSSHVQTYETSRMAYRLGHKPPCCTGNILRMFPVYVGSQWLTDGKKSIYKTLYGPGKLTHEICGKQIVIEEKSVYPYSDDIIISVKGQSVPFELNLRIPAWCKYPEVYVNGYKQRGVKSNEYYKIERTWKDDEIKIVLPKTPELINWDGYEAMTVNYGPLLFALPVEARIEKAGYANNTLRCDNYSGYKMTPLTDWNFILGIDTTDVDLVRVIKHDIKNPENPWAESPQPIQILVPMYKDPTWKEHYVKITDSDGKEDFAPITPPLPARGAMIFVLRKLSPEVKVLEPYGSTELRISMFPFWKEGNIAPEILATEW